MGGKSFQVPCFETPTRVPFFSRGGASKLYFACRPLSLLLTCSECPPPALISCCWDTLSVVPLILFLFDTGFISLSHSKGSFWGNEDNACDHPTRLQRDIGECRISKSLADMIACMRTLIVQNNVHMRILFSTLTLVTLNSDS